MQYTRIHSFFLTNKKLTFSFYLPFLFSFSAKNEDEEGRENKKSKWKVKGLKQQKKIYMHNTPNPTNIKKSQRKGKVERLVVCIFAPRLSSRKKLKPRKSSATAGQTFPKITIIFALLSKRYFPWRNFFSLFPFWLCYKHYISSWSWTSFSLFYRRNLKKYRDDCDCIVSRYFWCGVYK